MGSKPRDSGTMQQSSAGALAADQALASQATQNTAYAKQAHDLLFGAGPGTGSGTAATSGGILSSFLDPKSLDVTGPTGAFKASYNNAVASIAKGAAATQGSISRYMANRGFGNAPSGFEADQQRKAAQDAATAQGNAFSDATNNSYQDALSKFWNATNIASGSGAASTNAAISADSAAANNYSNLYGTASTPVPSTLATLAGGALSAGGQVGAAAASPKPPKPKT